MAPGSSPTGPEPLPSSLGPLPAFAPLGFFWLYASRPSAAVPGFILVAAVTLEWTPVIVSVSSACRIPSAGRLAGAIAPGFVIAVDELDDVVGFVGLDLVEGLVAGLAVRGACTFATGGVRFALAVSLAETAVSAKRTLVTTMSSRFIGAMYRCGLAESRSFMPRYATCH